MKSLQVLLALAMIIYLVETRHVHPRSIVRLDMEGIKNEALEEFEGTPIDVLRNLKTNRFVPINSVQFFKSMEPCEEGLERDVLGICREVWD